MKALLRLKPLLYPYRWHLAASALLAVPLAGIRMSVAPFVQRFVNDVMVSRDADRVRVYPLIFIVIFVLNFLIRFPHYYLLRIVIARVNQGLKNRLYEHLLGLSADHFTARSTGTLISRVGTDVQYIDGGLASLNALIREPLTFLGLFAYALHLNWRLTLITLVILPLLAWTFKVTARNLKRYIQQMQEENARLFSVLQESFSGIRVVQAFRLEGYLARKFRERNERFAQFHLKTAALEEAAHPLVELLTAFAIAGVLYYGGLLILDSSMQPGDLLAFFATFALLMNPLRLMNDVNIKLSAAESAARRIFEVLDWRSNLREAAAPKPAGVFRDAIEFADVRFAYPDSPEREVLAGVSFRLARGRKVALVGASGSGKSSTINLIPRVFDVSAGVIRFDGADVRELALDELRAQIAVVSQDVFLFNDTIEENIRCGRLDATTEQVREAARRAHALEFIERLPDGFATVIGDRGVKLSGGERQRLSIARAFLRDAPILLLDEATSSLDTASERVVQAALDDLMRDKTALVIAHRLSTVRGADEILVMSDGRIVERGTHAELAARDGEYARLQRAGWDA